MKPLPKELIEKLQSNDTRMRADEDFDPPPVIRLFTPDANMSWLVVSLDPDADTAFGLVDLGTGTPEMGAFSIAEISQITGTFGLSAELDRGFKTDRPISVLAKRASECGHISL